MGMAVVRYNFFAPQKMQAAIHAFMTPDLWRKVLENNKGPLSDYDSLAQIKKESLPIY